MGDGEKNITPEQVERNIGISKDFNQFELQNALGRRDVVKANRIVNYFAENERAHPLAVTLASLYYFFSKLLMVHYTKDRSKQNLASVLKVNPFFVQDYQAAAGRYSATKLVEIIALLRTYDMRSKGWEGNTVSDGELLKELVFKILHL
jgi:DNA polymerase-3 subunit delta